MRDLMKFAGADNPLHPSGMRSMVACPWRAAMEYLDAVEEGEGGAAGDTGSAVHAAVAHFHRGGDRAACLGAMGAGIGGYPRADLEDAARLFLLYAGDPRNAGVRAWCVEQPISFSIAPVDSTQEAIQVVGTLDQVREAEDGRLVLWDLKTSRRPPLEVLHEATFQIAAYAVGASILLGRPVEPGGIIAPRQYRANSTGPVFWSYPWKLADAEHILEAVRRTVDSIRRGQLWHVPGPGCQWCHAKSPDLCLPRLKEVKLCIGA